MDNRLSDHTNSHSNKEYNTPVSVLSMLFSASVPEAVAAELKVVSINQSDLLWDRIVSIEPVGLEHVYDIEVEGTHNFIGNGIFAHNTYQNGGESENQKANVVSLPASNSLTHKNSLASYSAVSSFRLVIHNAIDKAHKFLLIIDTPFRIHHFNSTKRNEYTIDYYNIPTRKDILGFSLYKIHQSINTLGFFLYKLDEPYIKSLYLEKHSLVPDISKLPVLYHGTSFENLKLIIEQGKGNMDSTRRWMRHKDDLIGANYFSFDKQEVINYVQGQDGILLKFDTKKLQQEGISFVLGPAIEWYEFITINKVPLSALTLESKQEVAELYLSKVEAPDASEVLANTLGYSSFDEFQHEVLSMSKFLPASSDFKLTSHGAFMALGLPLGAGGVWALGLVTVPVWLLPWLIPVGVLAMFAGGAKTATALSFVWRNWGELKNVGNFLTKPLAIFAPDTGRISAESPVQNWVAHTHENLSHGLIHMVLTILDERTEKAKDAKEKLQSWQARTKHLAWFGLSKIFTPLLSNPFVNEFIAHSLDLITMPVNILWKTFKLAKKPRNFIGNGIFAHNTYINGGKKETPIGKVAADVGQATNGFNRRSFLRSVALGGFAVAVSPAVRVLKVFGLEDDTYKPVPTEKLSVLLSGLTHNNPETRAKAVRELEQIQYSIKPTPDTVEFLSKALANEADARVRFEVIVLLATMNQRARYQDKSLYSTITGILEKASNDPDSLVRFTAQAAQAEWIVGDITPSLKNLIERMRPDEIRIILRKLFRVFAPSVSHYMLEQMASTHVPDENDEMYYIINLLRLPRVGDHIDINSESFKNLAHQAETFIKNEANKSKEYMQEQFINNGGRDIRYLNFAIAALLVSQHRLGLLSAGSFNRHLNFMLRSTGITEGSNNAHGDLSMGTRFLKDLSGPLGMIDTIGHELGHAFVVYMSEKDDSSFVFNKILPRSAREFVSDVIGFALLENAGIFENKALYASAPEAFREYIKQSYKIEGMCILCAKPDINDLIALVEPHSDARMVLQRFIDGLAQNDHTPDWTGLFKIIKKYFEENKVLAQSNQNNEIKPQKKERIEFEQFGQEVIVRYLQAKSNNEKNKTLPVAINILSQKSLKMTIKFLFPYLPVILIAISSIMWLFGFNIYLNMPVNNANMLVSIDFLKSALDGVYSSENTGKIVEVAAELREKYGDEASKKVAAYVAGKLAFIPHPPLSHRERENINDSLSLWERGGDEDLFNSLLAQVALLRVLEGWEGRSDRLDIFAGDLRYILNLAYALDPGLQGKKKSKTKNALANLLNVYNESLREAVKLENELQRYEMALRQNRDIVIDVSKLHTGNKEEKSKIISSLKNLNIVLGKTKYSESTSQIVFVEWTENGTDKDSYEKMKDMMKDMLRKKGLKNISRFKLVTPIVTSDYNLPVFDNDIVNAANLSRYLHGLGKKSDELIAMDIFTLDEDKDKWDLSEMEDKATLLVMLLGGLVYNATPGLEKDLKKLTFALIQA